MPTSAMPRKFAHKPDISLSGESSVPCTPCTSRGTAMWMPMWMPM